MRKTSGRLAGAVEPHGHQPRPAPGAADGRGAATMPHRAPLLDAEGAPLIHPSPAWVAQVRPGQLAHPEETAEAFATVTGLDDQQVLSVIRAAPQTHPLTLVTLSPAAYATLRKKLGRVPGLGHAPRLAPPVRHRRRRRDRHGRHRAGARAPGAGRLLPAGNHGRRVRAAAGVPAAAGRFGGDRGDRREPGRPPGGGAQAVGWHPGNRGPHDHRGRGAAGRGQRGRGPARRRGHRRGAGIHRARHRRRRPCWRRDPGGPAGRALPAGRGVHDRVRRRPCWPRARRWTSRFPAWPAPGSAAGPSPTSRPCRPSATQPLFSMDFAQSCGTAFTTLSEGPDRLPAGQPRRRPSASVPSGSCRSARSRARSGRPRPRAGSPRTPSASRASRPARWPWRSSRRGWTRGNGIPRCW